MASARETAFDLGTDEPGTLLAAVAPLPFTGAPVVGDALGPACAFADGGVNSFAQLEGGARTGGLAASAPLASSVSTVASVGAPSWAVTSASFSWACLSSTCDFSGFDCLDAGLGSTGVTGAAEPLGIDREAVDAVPSTGF